MNSSRSEIDGPVVRKAWPARLFAYVRANPARTGCEVVGSLAALAYVLFAGEGSLWAWPANCLGAVLLAYVFWRERLYADMGEYAAYFVLGIVGWINWVRAAGSAGEPARDATPAAGAEAVAEVTAAATPYVHTPLLTGLILLMIFAGGSYALGRLLNRYSNAALPYWDAWTTVLSLIAMWMLGYFYFEGWALYVIINVVSIGIYIHKRLPVVALYYAALLVTGIHAGWQWLAEMYPALGS